MTWTTVTARDNRGVSTPAGTLLDDRYRIDAVVGAGGMSTVYRAFDTVLERPVAIKLMHRDIAGDSGQLERFRREARAVAQLNHPHIVQVIDAGEEGEPDRPTPYIVFEYVEGETLKGRIRRLGRLDVPEAIAYAIEIARALSAAHERGIVHRDVKPQNVLVDEEGSAKVTDFGIARTLDEDGLTSDGRVLGTTDYVSPEQALGHDVGPQSDIYSLGVVLFEMLTGDVPFHGENQVTVAMKHVREDLPDVQRRRPEVSAALAAVLERATAKDLARRTPDAPSLIADLEDVLAIEAARSGQATGEATAVIRTLPGGARRRVPLRLRRSAGMLVALALAAIAATVVLLVLAAANTERGTSAPKGTKPPTPNEKQVRLSQTGAGDYDPYGGDGEHHEETSFLVDGDPATFWSTETYSGPLQAQKPGVGAYVDARPGVAATRIEIRSRTPGWKGAIYGARQSLPSSLPSDGWVPLKTVDDAAKKELIDLPDHGQRFRYYLVWITSLPPGENRVELSEVVLFALKKS
jgi:eukaryotic-like serine/threonine-protein kinase